MISGEKNLWYTQPTELRWSGLLRKAEKIAHEGFLRQGFFVT
jgi:hypothetical protein